jgi:hypothetical protein
LRVAAPRHRFLTPGPNADVYLSPAVRTVRDDPTADATVRLAVRLADEDAVDAVRDAVTGAGGTVAAVTRFGAVHADVPEPAVAGLLDALPAGVEAVETRVAVADEHGAEE